MFLFTSRICLLSSSLNYCLLVSFLKRNKETKTNIIVEKSVFSSILRSNIDLLSASTYATISMFISRGYDLLDSE